MLVEYEAIDRIGDQAAGFAQNIYTVIIELNELAANLMDKGVEAAAAILQSATTILGVVKPGIDAIAALVEYEAVERIGDRAAAFGWDIAIVVRELNELAANLDTQGTAAAASIASSVSSVIGLVKPAIDAIKALTDYTAVTNIRGLAAKLRADIQIVVNELVLLSQAFEAEAVEAAATFAGYAHTIVGLVKPAVDALKALGEYKPVAHLGAQMRRFRAQLERVLKELKRMAKKWEDKGLDDAAEFAEVVEEIVGLIEPVIKALVALAKSEDAKGLGAKMQSFRQNLEDVLRTLNNMAMDWLVAIPEAEQFLRSVGQVIDEVQDAIDTIAGLADYRAGDAYDAVTIIDEAFVEAVAVIEGWAPLFVNTWTTAKKVAAKAGQIAKLTQAAVDAIAGVGGEGSISAGLENWPQAMENAFNDVLGYLDTFGQDWLGGWQVIHETIKETADLVFWIGESIGPGTRLVSQWALGFDAMIVKVKNLVQSPDANGGLAAVQDKLQWINDHIWDVRTQFVGKFADMQTAANGLANELQRIVGYIGDPAGGGGGTGGNQGNVGASLSNTQPLEDRVNNFLSSIRTQYIPRGGGGGGGGGGGKPGQVCETFNVAGYEWTWCHDPFPSTTSGRSFAPVGAARYDRQLQGAGGNTTVSVNFGDVTINDTADMAALGGMVRSEVRNAIGGF